MYRLAYSTTTLVPIDEYTSERISNASKERLGFRDKYKCGYSPVQRRVHKVKYKDANYMP